MPVSCPGDRQLQEIETHLTHSDDSDSPTFLETTRLYQVPLPCLFLIIGTHKHIL